MTRGTERAEAVEARPGSVAPSRTAAIGGDARRAKRRPQARDERHEDAGGSETITIVDVPKTMPLFGR